MKNLRKATSVLLVLMMLISIMPAALTVSAAASFSDFPTGWSAPAMQAAVDNGLMFGKGDGTIGPQDMLTRAEAAAIINRAFGATVKADLSSYTDVSKSDWYYDEFAKAVNMDTIVGDGNGKLNPNGNITREEIFAVMARSLVLTGGDTSTLSRFSDGSQVSSWASAHICALVDGGYIDGNADGTLNPKGNITREEFAQMMHNIFKTYISNAGTVTSVGANCVMIRTPGVTLKGVTVEGDLVLGDGVGEGDIVLDNVTIKGRLLCRGGEGSVKLVNTTVGDKVVVYDVNGTVNFLNYEDEKPFDGKELHTPATFLKRKSSGGGGGSSRPSSNTYTYKVVYHLQGLDGAYATGYTTLDKYGSAKLGETITLQKGTDFDETLTVSGRTYKYTDKLGSKDVTITNLSSANVIDLYYNMVYNYTIDLDGGNIGGDASAISGTYTVDDTSFLPVTTPEKDGYIFNGWVTVDAEGNETSFTYTPGTTVGDLTIKAKWSPKTPGTEYYKILTNYDSAKVDRTSTVTDLNNIEAGTNVTITFTAKDGYKIDSIVSANGKGVVSGNTVTYTSIDADDTVTVTAKAIEYTYTFDLDGGTQVGTKPLTGTYTVETTANFTPDNPTKSGYDFVKWVYTSGGTGDFVFAAGMTGNIAVKAVWKAKSSGDKYYKIDVNYDSTMVSMTPNVPDLSKIKEGTTVKITFVSNAGYKIDSITSANSKGVVSGDATDGYVITYAAIDADDTVTVASSAITPTVEEGTLKFVPTYDDATGIVTVDVTLDKMPSDIENIHSITIDYGFENEKLTFNNATTDLGGKLDASASKISWFESDKTKGISSASFDTTPLKLFTLTFDKKDGATGEVNFKFTVNKTTPSVTDFDGKKSEKIKTEDGKVDIGSDIPIVNEGTLKFVPTYDGVGVVTVDVTLDKMPSDIENIHSITIDYGFENEKFTFKNATTDLGGKLDASASKISWFESDKTKGISSASFDTTPLKLFTLTFDKKDGATGEVNFKFTVNKTTPSVTDFDGKKSEKIKTEDGKVDLGTPGDKYYKITVNYDSTMVDMITATDLNMVKEGTDVTITFTAKDGYKIDSIVSENGKGVVSGNTVTYTAVDEDDTVTVTSSAITPTVEEGTLKFVPTYDGVGIVTVDVTLDKMPSDIENIHSITIDYGFENEKLTFNNATTDLGGKLDASASKISWFESDKTKGISSASFDTTPLKLFTLTFDKKDGATGEVNFKFTVNKTTPSVTDFDGKKSEKIKTEDGKVDLGTPGDKYYKITVDYDSAMVDMTTATDLNKVKEGTDVTITFTAKDGYKIDSIVSENGKGVVSGNTVTYTAVDEDDTVTVTSSAITPTVEEGTLKFVPTYDDATGIVTVDVTLDKMPSDIENIHSITIDYGFENEKLTFNNATTDLGGKLDASASKISWFESDKTKGISSASFDTTPLKLFTLTFDKKDGATGEVNFKFTVNKTTPSVTDFDGKKSEKIKTEDGKVDLGTPGDKYYKITVDYDSAMVDMTTAADLNMVKEGTDVTITFKAKDGYKIDSIVSANGKGVVSGNTVTYTAVDEDDTVTVASSAIALTKFKVNLYDGSNALSENLKGSVEVLANEKITQAQIDAILGSKESKKRDGYTDSEGNVLHYIYPELWYNNGTDWVIFDTDMPITKDIDVCLMFRTISLYVQDDVYLDGSYIPGIKELGFTLVYDSESSIAESALDAMAQGKTLLKNVISALESKDVYVYDELLDKLKSKGIIDDNRKILNQSVTLKMADFLTVAQIEGEVDKYIEENIDNDEFIKKILSNRSVVDSMLANESLKKTFMADASLRDKLVNDDDFIKELANDDEMVDSIISSDSFKKSFIENDETLEYVLTSDALKDYIKTNDEFRKFLVDESIQYVKDVYFNGTETNDTVKNYINEKLLENGPGSIREELYANDTVKQTVKNWLKEKLDNDPSELLTNATFKNYVRQKVREGLTNGDPEIKAIVKDNLRDYNKVGTKLKELLLGDDTFPAEIKSDVKVLIDGDVTLKNNIRDDLKADDNVKAQAETRIKDELVDPSSNIRAKALTELKDDIKASSEFSDYVSSDDFKNKVRSAEFKNKMTSLSDAQKSSILNKLKDTVDPTQYQSQIKRLMSKDDIKNIIQAQGATVSDADLDDYLNGTLAAATSAQYDQHLADGYASNKDTIFALENFDTVVNGFCGSDEIFSISGSAFITELTNTAFDICYDEDMFNACIDSYLGTPANFDKVYDKYFNDYFDLYFDTVYGEYYDEVANDKTKFVDFYDKYAADYIKDNFVTLYDNHFDSFYDSLAGNQDYQDAMDQYMNDNFDDLYANNIVNYYRTYCDDEQFNKYFNEFYVDKDNFDDYYDNHVSEVVKDTYNTPANTEVINIVNDYLNTYVGEIINNYADNTLDADMATAINDFMKTGVKDKIRNKYDTDTAFRDNMSNLIETNAKDYVEKYVNDDPSLTAEQRKMIKDAIAEYADDIATDYVNGTISAENKAFVDEQIEKYVDSAIDKYLNGTDDTIKTLIAKHAKTAVDAYKETKAYKDLMADFAAKKENITINKDNIVLTRGIASAVRGYTYDKIKAEFIPSKYYKVIELIDEDVVRRYVLQATKDFADGLDAKCDIVEASSDANITETYPAALTAVVDIMNDWVVPYYNKFVAKATDKLKSVPEVDYDNNAKLKELTQTNWLEKFFEKTTDGAYRLKLNSIEQYYDVVYDAAVIAHDALVYYNKFDDATIESKTKAAAAILATYANKANEIIMNYITTGELPKGLTLDKILDINYRLRNLYNKYEDKIETALDKYEQYLDRDYAKVFDKLSTATIVAEGEHFKATDAALEIKVGDKLFGIDSAFDALLSGNNTVSDANIQEKIDKVVNKIKSAEITPVPLAHKIYVDAYKGTIGSRTFRGHETGNITIEINRYLQ